MAEALATLSLVCNVMTVITFTRDAIASWRSTSKDGSPDPRLASNTAHLSTLVSALQETTNGFDPRNPKSTLQSHTGKGDSLTIEAESRLKQLASDLMEDAAKIQALLGKVAVKSPSGSFISAIKYKFYYQRRISSLESQIDRARNLMNLELSSKLW